MLKNKKVLVLYSFLVVSLSLFSQIPEIREVEFELVHIFPVGRNDGALGFKSLDTGGLMLDSGEHDSPTTFAFGSDGLLYICDTINKRMSVFDINFDFKKNFRSGLSQTKKLQVLPSGEFLSYGWNNSVVKASEDGKFLWGVVFDESEWKSGIRINSIKVINDNLVIARLNNGDLVGANNPTKERLGYTLLNNAQVLEELSKINGTQTSFQYRSASGSTNPNRLTNDFDDFFSNSDSAYSGTKLRTLSIEDRQTSFNPFEDLDILNGNVSSSSARLLGEDNSGNYYWYARRLFLIYNHSGQLIDILKEKDTISQKHAILSPAGDLYILKYLLETEEFGLYRLNK